MLLLLQAWFTTNIPQAKPNVHRLYPTSTNKHDNSTSMCGGQRFDYLLNLQPVPPSSSWYPPPFKAIFICLANRGTHMTSHTHTHTSESESIASLCRSQIGIITLAGSIAQSHKVCRTSYKLVRWKKAFTVSSPVIIPYLLPRRTV